MRHGSRSALTLLKHQLPNQQSTSENKIIQEILLLEKGRDLASSLVPELTPGKQVASDGHTLHHMVFLSAEHCVSISSLYIHSAFN